MPQRGRRPWSKQDPFWAAPFLYRRCSILSLLPINAWVLMPHGEPSHAQLYMGWLNGFEPFWTYFHVHCSAPVRHPANLTVVEMDDSRASPPHCTNTRMCLSRGKPSSSQCSPHSPVPEISQNRSTKCNKPWCIHPSSPPPMHRQTTRQERSTNKRDKPRKRVAKGDQRAGEKNGHARSAGKGKVTTCTGNKYGAPAWIQHYHYTILMPTCYDCHNLSICGVILQPALMQSL
jgi:hypothetical protein